MDKGDVVAGRDLNIYKRCKYKLHSLLIHNIPAECELLKSSLIFIEAGVKELESICLFKCCERHLYILSVKRSKKQWWPWSVDTVFGHARTLQHNITTYSIHNCKGICFLLCLFSSQQLLKHLDVINIWHKHISSSLSWQILYPDLASP